MRSRVGHGGFHGVSSNIRIVRQNVCDRVAVLDAAEHGINSHSRAANDWRAVLDASINDKEWIALRAHHEIVFALAVELKGRVGSC